MDIELEERIAIMIHDGGLSPAEAERQARKIRQGRADQPDQPKQVEMDFGRDEFQQAMRRLWRDY